MTSLEFDPIRRATLLCHFDQNLNGSVATHFILLNSTATNNAKGDYVAAPQRLSQNEEPAGKKRNELGTNLVSLQNINKRRRMKSCKFETYIHVFLILCYIFSIKLITFAIMEYLLILYFVLCFTVWAQSQTLRCPFLTD